MPERAGGAGLPTRAGDRLALAAALARFVDEPALWRQLRERIPPPSPGLDAHVDALLAVYDRARGAPPPPRAFEPVPALRRVMFLQKQRETALGKLIPPGGPR